MQCFPRQPKSPRGHRAYPTCHAWGRTEQAGIRKLGNMKEHSRLWARNRRASKGTLGGGREKGARSGRGPGDCITAAPPAENELRTAATIMALGSGRASRASPSSPGAAAAAGKPRARSLQTFPSRPERASPTPSFLLCACVRACVRAYVHLCVRVCAEEKLKIIFFSRSFFPPVLVVVNLIGIGCAH